MPAAGATQAYYTKPRPLVATSEKQNLKKLEMNKNIIILIVFFINSNLTFGQNIEKSFLGWWGDTFWEFNFSKNGNYERITSGHFGFTKSKGKYKIENDTIKIVSGYEDSHGTINDKYIIDENDILIDLKLGYGHKRIFDSDKNKKINYRELLYPEIQAINNEAISDIEEVLNLAFNSPKLKNYYHFDSITSREFIIVNYFKLKANIEVDGRKAIFKNKNDINEKFFIEFESITRFYDRISFTIKIPNEGVQIDCYYGKENGKWKEDIIKIVEK